MTDPDAGLDRSTPLHIPRLLDEYRRQQEALRRHTDEVDRLFEEVLAAADDEAASIVASAQAEIRRVVVGARQNLLGLIAQVETLRQSNPGTSDAADQAERIGNAQQRLTGVRREMRKLLVEARAELASLRKDAPPRSAPRALSPPPDSGRQPVAQSPSPSARVDAPADIEPPHGHTGGHGGDNDEPRAAIDEPRADTNAPREPAATIERHRNATTAVVMFAVVGFGIAIGTLAWAGRSGRARAAGSSGTTAAIASALASPKRAARTPGSDGALLSSRRTAEVFQTVRFDPKPPLRPGSPALRPGSGQGPAADGASARGSARPPLSVVVAAQRPVWIRTTVDGQADVGRTLQPGESRTITAAREVAFRAGDAGALTVAVNGGARQPLGRDGETVTRRFAAGQPAAPSTTPTPSGAAPSARAAAPEAPRPVATVGTHPSEPADRTDLTERAQKWLDAYYRQDASTLASISTRELTTSDDRHPDERLPAGLAVRRSFEGLTIQVAGDQAVLSGKMIEHADAGGQPVQRASWISQMWTRQNGRWTLMDARIRAEGRLK